MFKISFWISDNAKLYSEFFIPTSFVYMFRGTGLTHRLYY